ncbi:MAG: AmpG family muropeptide MFS transporter [Candidatus Eisenbacteria bacterium]|nr:AmpG family muropeptide MFS transporter [Candidatus Eisenbacteria bacterium]
MIGEWRQGTGERRLRPCYHAPRMSPRRTHPSVFMFLIIPFGAMGGYVSVALAYLFSKEGVPVERIAALVAVGIVPHTWKFFWAPLVDSLFTRKGWYLAASVLSALGILATGMAPIRESSIPLLTTIILISNFAATFLGMATDSLMAYATPQEQKGRAGGWFQAGNLGGAGLGGGAGLLLAQRLPAPWMAGAILAAACLLCCLALLFVPEPASTIRDDKVLRTLRNVALDLWSMAKSRIGFLALFLCFLPIGSGAASGLWSAVAGDWSASAETVALVTGIMGGILSAAGCLIGGYICDRMDRKTAYVIYGALQAACAVGMAFAPRTERMYIVFTSLYAVITGLTFAGFTAFVLEAMGTGAAATKYNVFASLSNTPIYYMTLVDGWAHTRWGARGMLNTEATLCIAGMLLFFGVAAGVKRMRPARAS